MSRKSKIRCGGLIFRTSAGFIFIALAIALPAMSVDFSQEPKRLGSGQVLAIALSPDGTILAASHRTDTASALWQAQTVLLWDVEAQKQVGELKIDGIESIAFSPDSTLLALGGGLDNTIHLWDVAGQNQLGVMQSPTRWGVHVAFSPDGRTLASSGLGDNAVRLWDVQTQKQIGVLQLTNSATAVAFSPDGRLLASNGIGAAAVRLWDVAGQKQVGDLVGHTGEILSLAFSPDGKILASGGGWADKAVYLWDVQAQTRVGVLGGLSAHVGSVAFSPNGKLLASTVYWDDTVHLWDAEGQEQVGVLTGHDASDIGWGDNVVFSSNGKWLACGSENGVELWEVNLPASGAYAFRPKPADKATDVPRDVVLNWTPGIYVPPINGHRVYFSESFNDVNEGIGGIAQDANSYTPAQRLDFDKTYYWRVAEVNGPPDYTVHQGRLWSFTTEPIGYAIENITATASSSSRGSGPENTIDGSGLDDSGLLHGKDDRDMWLSGSGEPGSVWIQYELDKVYKLHEMWVWNSNQMVESLVGFGLKDVTIEYSTNGTDYTTLGTTHEFARASGTSDYAHNTTIDFSGATAKYIRLTANSNWGGILPQYGLSEVRFFSIPVWVREPSPDSGTTDVAVDVTLGFRAGREADKHDVYLSTDEQAVIDGTASVTPVSQASHGPLSLDLGTTYYWKVNEVNEAQTTTTWQGDVSNFSTGEYLLVEDFEAYNDLDPNEPDSNRIFHSWIDGFEDLTNGSIVGYAEAPFAEPTIVHEGGQSMPLLYDNTAGAAYSEAERTFAVGQDWTKHGVKTLSLRFSGAASNVAAQMYVKLNGYKVTYVGDAGNLTRIGWQTWNIELAPLGVDLQNVTTLSIGFERSGLLGGSGVVFFDDIRLYPYSRQFITPAEPNSANLTLHYEFEGTTNDSTGVNNGTAFGGPTYVLGKVGQALLLDGVDDYVAIQNLNYATTGLAEVSVAAWIRTSNWDNQVIVAFDRNEYWRLEINLVGGGPGQIGWDVMTDTGQVDYGSTTRVDDGQWHHVAGVFDNGTLTIYLDGNPEASASGGPTYGSGTPRYGYIGLGSESTSFNADPREPAYFFDGAVDDVRIYNNALSHAEVRWLAGRTEPFDKPF